MTSPTPPVEGLKEKAVPAKRSAKIYVANNGWGVNHHGVIVVRDLLAHVEALEARLEQAGKLYEMTLANEIRWMQRAEAAEAQVAALKAHSMPDGFKCRDLGECVYQHQNTADMERQVQELEEGAGPAYKREKLLRIQAEAQVQELQREVARLTEYAQHKAKCQIWCCKTCGLWTDDRSHEPGVLMYHQYEETDCTCGLTSPMPGPR